MTKLPIVVLVATAMSSFSAIARADDPSADDLYKQAVEAIRQSDAETACPLFAKSYDADPRPGTAYELARCEDKIGKIAAASNHYDDFLGAIERMPKGKRAPFKTRADAAQARLTALLPLVPQLTLTLPKDAPDGVKVTRDGVKVKKDELGQPQPVEPGKHEVITKVGGESSTQSVKIDKGEAATLELQLPKKAAPPPPTVVKRAAPEGAGSKTPAYIAWGVGGAAVGISLIAGGIAYSKRSTLNGHCHDFLCDQTGKNAADGAQSAATVGTISFIVGLLAGGAGTYLYFYPNTFASTPSGPQDVPPPDAAPPQAKPDPTDPDAPPPEPKKKKKPDPDVEPDVEGIRGGFIFGARGSF